MTLTVPSLHIVLLNVRHQVTLPNPCFSLALWTDHIVHFFGIGLAKNA